MEALQHVVDYIVDQGGELIEYGLTPDKVWERAELVDDPERIDWIVFEMERHRSILGTIYVPGLAMPAFITYWPRYAFHPVEKKFEELGEYRKAEVSIDHWDVADRWISETISFDFEHIGAEQHRCKELCGNEERVVSSQKEVEDFAAEIVRGWYLDFFQDELSDLLRPSEIQEHLDRIRRAAEELMREKAKDAWEDYQAGLF